MEKTNTIKIKSFTCKFLVKDGEAYIKEPSSQMCAFFGTTEEDYKDGMLKRIRKDIGDTSANALQEMLNYKANNGKPFRLVYPSKRFDGSHCNMQIDAYPLEKVEDGYIYSVIEMDISELIDAQHQTQELMKENRALLDDSPIAMGIYHIDGKKFKLIYTNAEYYRVHHGSKTYWDNFNEKDAMERIYPEDRVNLYNEWRKVIEHPDSMYDATYRCRGEDNQEHWINLKARLGEKRSDGIWVCYATYTNVDQEKNAEVIAAHLSKSMLDTINSLPTISGLCEIKPNGDIRTLSLSDEFCKMMGATQEELTPLYMKDSLAPVHPNDREQLLTILNKHTDEYQPFNIAYRLMKADGTYKWISANMITFKSLATKYLYINYSDIDDLKKQEELLKSQYESAQSYIENISDSFMTSMRVNLSTNTIESINGASPKDTDPEIENYDKAMKKVVKNIIHKQDRVDFLKSLKSESLIQAFYSGQLSLTKDALFDNRNKYGIIWTRTRVTLTKRPGSDDIIAFFVLRNINNIKNIELIMNNVIINRFDFIAVIDINAKSIDMISVNEKSKGISEIHSGPDYDTIMKAYVNEHIIEDERATSIQFFTL